MNKNIPILFLIFVSSFSCNNFDQYKSTFKSFLESNDMYNVTPLEDTDQNYALDVKLKSQLKEHLASILLQKTKTHTLIGIQDTVSQNYQHSIPDFADNTVQFQQQIFEEIFKRLVVQPRAEVKNIFLEDLLEKIKKEMNYNNYVMSESQDKKIYKVNYMNEEATTLQVSIKIIGDLNEKSLYDLKFSTDFYFSTQNDPQNLNWIVDIFGQNTLIKSTSLFSSMNFLGKKESDFFDQFKLKGEFIDCNSKIIKMIGQAVPYLYKAYQYQPNLVNYKDIAHLISKYAQIKSVNGNYLVVSTFEPKEDQIGDHTVRFFKVDDLDSQVNLTSDQAIGTFTFYRMDKSAFDKFLLDKIKIDQLLETMFSQVVKIFKEEYQKVYKDSPQQNYEIQVEDKSGSYYTTLYIIVKDESGNEFLRFDFQEYKNGISMTNNKSTSNNKTAMKFQTEDYTPQKFRNFINMALMVSKISK